MYLLSRKDSIEQILSILSPQQIEKFASFIVKYVEEVQRESWNEEMLRNTAYLLLRSGRYVQAIKIYEELLKTRPDHLDLLNLKSLALITTRLDEKLEQALPILLLRSLHQRYPENGDVCLNYALANSLSGNHEEVLKHMELLLNSDYAKRHGQNLLDDVLFNRTREAHASKVNELRAKFIKNERVCG